MKIIFIPIKDTIMKRKRGQVYFLQLMEYKVSTEESSGQWEEEA